MMKSIQLRQQLRPLSQVVFRRIQGVTLIEIMLMLILLAVGTSIFFRIYLNTHESTKSVKTERGILLIENAMNFYKLDNGFYPTNSQGIKALVTKPTTSPIPLHWQKYLKAIPLDPKGKPYLYANPGKNHEIDIYSENVRASSWWDNIQW